MTKATRTRIINGLKRSAKLIEQCPENGGDEALDYILGYIDNLESPDIQICKVCGDEFVPHRAHSPARRKYCSFACRNKG